MASSKPRPSQYHHHSSPFSSSTASSLSSSMSSSRDVTTGNSTSNRPKAKMSRRTVTPTSRSHSNSNSDEDSCRVRVAVRLRPRNSEDILPYGDFADCVELQPELKRLKLRKNNWSSESYRFDEVFAETVSQKRVYEVVAKPVVESVLSGYNGTVMAYGQTGTGKTYMLGRLGKDDAAERGIMVRALEDIISHTSYAPASVEVSYLQLYMESIQDLLAPDKIGIHINEDPKTGEVLLPGATRVLVHDLNHFLELLQIGENNRHAANTKLNTESSRSHAILMVYVRRSVSIKDEMGLQDGRTTESADNIGVPVVRKSKLLIVDLAGSERIDKSGTEGHLLEEAKSINLSLTSLGKCINALAENSSHIPTRDSKLTRLLRDSFGGSARTSLIITIGPSLRYQAETSSTIMFGQRAMKVVNVVKLKEEFDYEGLCRQLESQVDELTAEIERQKRLREDDRCELEKKHKECRAAISATETTLRKRSEFLEKANIRLESELKQVLVELSCKEDQNELMHNKIVQLQVNLDYGQEQQQLNTSAYQNVLAETTQMYEEKIAELVKQIEEEQAKSANAEEQLHSMKKLLIDHQMSIQQYEMECSTYQKKLLETSKMYEKNMSELVKQLEDARVQSKCVEEQLDSAKKLLGEHHNPMQGKNEIGELKEKLNNMTELYENCTSELNSLNLEYKDLLEERAKFHEELHTLRQKLLLEEKQRKNIENELLIVKKCTPDTQMDFEDKHTYMKEIFDKGSPANISTGSQKSNSLRETQVGQRTTIAKICREVGLDKILAMLRSEDLDVQIHAVKVVANLAAEDIHQEKITEEGGLDALLMLLGSSKSKTILRVASGAIANLAMNECNQSLIMSKGGAELLANIASKTDDLQTLRMVAGALANLCGNEKMHMMLKEHGGIKALLGMVRLGSNDVIAQVARGIANFAKCESRAVVQGHRKGRSLLMEDDILVWLVSNCHNTSASIQRHIELTLCHLAQNEDNAKNFISSGAVQVLARISVESSREDIRSLAKKTLRSIPAFQLAL